MLHPAFNLDLETSDFHLITRLKYALRGERFAKHVEVKEALQNWLQDQLK